MKLEIVTPEKKVVDATVDSVTVPTANGEVGILPNHSPLISSLKPGILSYSVKGSAEKLVVAGGFVEVSGTTVSILTDIAETAEEIDADSARAEREAAEKAMLSSGSTEAFDAETERLQRAQARLALAGGK